MPQTTQSPKQVVIIGAGFAGLNAAKILGKAPGFKVILIDKTNHHLFQPLLYQVATAALSPADIAMPIREIFRDYPQVETLMGTVTAINKEDKTINLEDNQIISFDYLIVAPGNKHAYFGKNHWESFAPGLKTLQDAVQIREKILASFELAERTTDPILQDKLLTFIIVGGGPTGVEMAGAIAEIAHQGLQKDFRHINPKQTKVILIEGGQQLLNGYPIRLANIAQKDLTKMGVTVILNTRVTDITHEGVLLEGRLLPAVNIIWAAGNETSPLLKSLDIAQDKQGRVMVERNLSIPSYPEIFVVGDAALYQDQQARALPAIAPVAQQQGRYVAKMIIQKTKLENSKPFHYVDRGMMATIGKYKALVLSGPWQSSGFLAWLAWCFVHIYFLIGFRTKLFVFAQWAFYFFRGQRNVRLLFKTLNKIKS